MHFGVRQTQMQIQLKSKLKTIEIISISRPLGPGICRWVWDLQSIGMGQHLRGSAVWFQIPSALDSGRPSGLSSLQQHREADAAASKGIRCQELGVPRRPSVLQSTLNIFPASTPFSICPEELSPKACLS